MQEVGCRPESFPSEIYRCGVGFKVWGLGYCTVGVYTFTNDEESDGR